MSASRPVVYVVDDDASWLTAVARLLRASGHVVRTFASASGLLGKLPADPEGCLLADLRMPGLDGLQLQKALERAKGRRRRGGRPSGPRGRRSRRGRRRSSPGSSRGSSTSRSRGA
jgi:CheY-like chemotaxis protein